MPNWPELRVVLNDRAAMYAEKFPAALADLGPETAKQFTHERAQGLLYTFAGAWPGLGRDTANPKMRFLYVTLGDTVCRFRAVELAPGAIVVDDAFGL